jgi:hypothetical protein
LHVLLKFIQNAPNYTLAARFFTLLPWSAATLANTDDFSTLTIMKQSLLLAVLAAGFLSACQKETLLTPQRTDSYALLNFNDAEAVDNAIGSNYNVHTSNLFGITEDYLGTLSSDALFGLPTPKVDAQQLLQTIHAQPPAEAASSIEQPAILAKNNETAAATYYNTYSWLQKNPAHTQLYNWDAYIYVENDGGMSAPADNDKVVFYALQTDFGNGQGAHTGLQWANGIKKVNWGGYWNGVVQPASTFCGTHSCAYNWSINTPYRFRVWKLGVNTATNRTQWGAWVMNMWTNQETFIGSFYSTANNQWITSQVTWIETIKTGTTPLSNRNIQAVFSYLVYRTASGVGPFSGAYQAYHASADYSSVAAPTPSQDRNVSYTFDNIWFGVQTKTIRHKFNTTRTVPAGTVLW